MIGRHGDGAVLFEHVQVFDGTGSPRFPASVLVRGNRIAAVVPGSERVDVPDVHLTVVDGRGRTLMPGLVEGHAHLTWPSSIERVVNGMSLPIEDHVLTMAANARITLDHGFTSAYSAGALGERMEVALRDHIDAGLLPGPRLRASALEKGMEGVMGVPEGHDPTHDRSIDGLRRYVALDGGARRRHHQVPDVERRGLRARRRERADVLRGGGAGDRRRGARRRRLARLPRPGGRGREARRAGGLPLHLPLHARRYRGPRPAGGAPRGVVRRAGARPAVRRASTRPSRSASIGRSPSGWVRCRGSRPCSASIRR